MGLIGNLGGQFLGRAAGQYFGGNKGAEAGQSIGGAIGQAMPWFKKGGLVKRTGVAKVHKGEYVLPKSVKPTVAQKKAVAKLHKKK